jgi:tripartite-type tricarboxylate transporter receptor subunit TctC
MHKSLWVAAVCATFLGLVGATPAGAKDYYAGKTLTMLVPSSAGGGLSVIIRAFAKVYTKHIPGNPTIVVKNMPGGGGTRSLNFLYSKAKPNGLTINFGSWNAAGVVSKRKGIRYVPEKFAFIGAGSIPWITVVRSDLKPRISKATEIVKVAKFKVGGRSSDRSLDLVGNMSLQLIGASYKFIGGYRGMGKIKPALLAGEVQGANMGYVGYHLYFKDGIVKEGKGVPLWYSSSFDANGNPVGNPQVKDAKLKPFHEVYKAVHGKLPSGALWEAYKWYNNSAGSMALTTFAPPGTPKAAIDALRKGYYATANDPAYLLPEAKRIGIGLNFVPLEQGQKILRTFRNVSPAVLAELEKISNIDIRKRKKRTKKKK